MNAKTRFLIAAFALAASGIASAQTPTLLNASYDVAREFYKDINAAFVPWYRRTAGQDVKIEQAHAGSSAQGRAVADGLAADVVTMNTTTDVDFLARKGVVAKDWPQRYRAGAAAAGGIVVRLERAVVVGPVARLELVAAEDAKAGDNRGVAALIEAQIPAREFGEKGFREGETLVATPRRARVFVESAR